MKREAPPKSATPPSTNQAKTAPPGGGGGGGGGNDAAPKSPPGTPGSQAVKHPSGGGDLHNAAPHTPSSLSDLNPPSNNSSAAASMGGGGGGGSATPTHKSEPPGTPGNATLASVNSVGSAVNGNDTPPVGSAGDNGAAGGNVAPGMCLPIPRFGSSTWL